MKKKRDINNKRRNTEQNKIIKTTFKKESEKDGFLNEQRRTKSKMICIKIDNIHNTRDQKLIMYKQIPESIDQKICMILETRIMNDMRDQKI